jgi:hypothetical protein
MAYDVIEIPEMHYMQTHVADTCVTRDWAIERAKDLSRMTGRPHAVATRDVKARTTAGTAYKGVFRWYQDKCPQCNGRPFRYYGEDCQACKGASYRA